MLGECRCCITCTLTQMQWKRRMVSGNKRGGLVSFKSVAAKGFIEVLSTQAVLLLLVSPKRDTRVNVWVRNNNDSCWLFHSPGTWKPQTRHIVFKAMSACLMATSCRRVAAGCSNWYGFAGWTAGTSQIIDSRGTSGSSKGSAPPVSAPVWIYVHNRHRNTHTKCYCLVLFIEPNWTWTIIR